MTKPLPSQRFQELKTKLTILHCNELKGDDSITKEW